MSSGTSVLWDNALRSNELEAIVLQAGFIKTLDSEGDASKSWIRNGLLASMSDAIFFESTGRATMNRTSHMSAPNIVTRVSKQH